MYYRIYTEPRATPTCLSQPWQMVACFFPECLTTVQRRSLRSIPVPTVYTTPLHHQELTNWQWNQETSISLISSQSYNFIIPGVRLRLCSSPICRCTPCPSPIISQPRIASESPLPQRALELEARKSFGGDGQGSRVSTTKLKIGRHPGYLSESIVFRVSSKGKGKEKKEKGGGRDDVET